MRYQTVTHIWPDGRRWVAYATYPHDTMIPLVAGEPDWARAREVSGDDAEYDPPDGCRWEVVDSPFHPVPRRHTYQVWQCGPYGGVYLVDEYDTRAEAEARARECAAEAKGRWEADYLVVCR